MGSSKAESCRRKAGVAAYHFKLYVTGKSVRSQLAIENLKRICDRQFGDDAAVEVIDVLATPEEAENARILTTPTLIRQQPEPERRVTGDLSDESAVMRALGLIIPRDRDRRDGN